MSTEQIPPALALAYGTFLRLGWSVQWVGNRRIVGFSRKQWKKPVDMLVAEVSDEQISFTPMLPDGTKATAGMTKKRNEAFAAGLEATQASVTDEQISAWAAELLPLQEATSKVIAEEAEEQRQLAVIMPDDSKGSILTFGIIGVNVLVFIPMAATGVGIFEPSGEGLIRWGANFAPYTLGGQYWRLLTACFIHIGIIHLAFNMYALLQVGGYLESLLGRLRYACAYIACGLCGSIASLWWHKEPVLSAGASGAIFGLFGLFLALLTTDLLPKKARAELLRSIGIFVVFNLLYGMKSGIDNAAHLGGLLSGFACGYLFLPALKSGRRHEVALPVIALLISIGGALAYVAAHRDDRLDFIEMEKALTLEETKGLEPYKKEAPPEELLRALKRVEPSWQQAQQLVRNARSLKLPEAEAKRLRYLQQYADLRLRQNQLEQKQLQDTPAVQEELLQINARIVVTLDSLK